MHFLFLIVFLIGIPYLVSRLELAWKSFVFVFHENRSFSYFTKKYFLVYKNGEKIKIVLFARFQFSRIIFLTTLFPASWKITRNKFLCILL